MTKGESKEWNGEARKADTTSTVPRGYICPTSRRPPLQPAGTASASHPPSLIAYSHEARRVYAPFAVARRLYLFDRRCQAAPLPLPHARRLLPLTLQNQPCIALGEAAYLVVHPKTSLETNCRLQVEFASRKEAYYFEDEPSLDEDMLGADEELKS